MKTTKHLVLLALLAAIIFVQEEILTFLPNIQLTVFLLVLYSKKLGMKDTLIIVVIHTLLDNLVMGSLNPMVITTMLVGWGLVPILLNTVFKKLDDNLSLAFCGILFALIYSWLFVAISTTAFQMNFWTYIKADIIFEIALAASSFLSILWLYNPCSHVFDKLNH